MALPESQTLFRMCKLEADWHDELMIISILLEGVSRSTNMTERLGQQSPELGTSYFASQGHILPSFCFHLERKEKHAQCASTWEGFSSKKTGLDAADEAPNKCLLPKPYVSEEAKEPPCSSHRLQHHLQSTNEVQDFLNTVTFSRDQPVKLIQPKMTPANSIPLVASRTKPSIEVFSLLTGQYLSRFQSLIPTHNRMALALLGSDEAAIHLQVWFGLLNKDNWKERISELFRIIFSLSIDDNFYRK
ncbi:hypothetical protein E5288_WYG009854 [Bos mutus]|uniref:Uncharacterized protein n=1 Tax=Bos mutus TaxID=72004 RepID=A0A6B0RY01_9CETA|nr:hypothetical protein [Bos mutus]